MNEEMTRKKKPAVQRLVTGACLGAALIAVIALGKWTTAAALLAAMCLALGEEYGAFAAAGHHPVRWTGYAALIVALPMMLIDPVIAFMPVMVFFCMTAMFCVMRREKPELPDVMLSITPLLTLVLPGMCIMGLINTDPRSMQLYLLMMLFVIPILGDTMAYVVGSNMGGPKLCPLISPNKTISGAIGGLLGSVLGAVLVGRIFRLCVPDVAFAPFWIELLMGLLGGAAAQLGDLFASMIKRYSRIKDFSNLFPGHGGMLDRLDSIVFNAIIIYCFRAFLL